MNWTTADAESCSASGGNWSGGKAVGTASEVVKVDATVTFTLTCAGPGGSANKTVTVTATPIPATSGGGGGSTDMTLLAILFALLLICRGSRGRALAG